jgi:DNA-binding NarL/FixJ family response regulator
LLVAGPGNRARTRELLGELGFATNESDDPYAAMTEICRRPLVYRAIILSLASVYREELAIISTIKARFSHLEVWLAHTDGRQGLLAEAMRLGADGLLADDGLHRVAAAAPSAQMNQQTPASHASTTAPESAPEPADAHSTNVSEESADEESPNAASAGASTPPVLSADELRALLHEQSAVPPDEL